MTSAGRILNVDDNEAARYVKSRILRMAGFEVIEAANGAAAARLLRSESPELVLLDVRLPDIDGRELAASIKADPTLARIAILQTSASYVDSKNRIAALDAGADGYLVEPMEPEELLANVRALLRMRRAERELQAALHALREADRRKDEFLAMLAHELRNPLAPIRNAVEVMRKTDEPESQEQAREIIGRQVEHLARLVDDLLEMSRITQGKVALQKTVVPLRALVDAALDVVRPMAARSAQALTVSLPADEIWVEVDPVRVSQMIGNLLHNAAKFTPRGGRIDLTLRRSANAIEIVVSDNGVGIPADLLQNVFDLFSQSDRTLDRAQGGLGIGLSLVRGLVAMHGGEVAAHSDGPGNGSRFTVRLPTSIEVAQPAARLSRAAQEARVPVGRRILIVEDNADSADAMRLLLQGMGHEVLTVSDGAEAITQARAFLPDVLLLDIGLPGMDGYELARRFRLLQETSRARVVAVTGYGQPADRARSAAAGFDFHLVKPVDPGKLVEVLTLS